MTTLTKWMPFRELDTMERRMQRMLEDIGFGPFTVPAADFYETDRDYVIELEVPGFEEKELGIEVSDHTLTVKGERKAEAEEEQKAFRFHERLEKTFERQFYLPPEADTEHAKATFAKGVLKVLTPKAPETAPRKVPIGS
ncbi:MAG TPA: Hsp20/alpha crystallin family protein [Gaiellaceae bacterium]|nr:Hsp20/alpha crystallin family protein [Gaiellaceae bacterium]